MAEIKPGEGLLREALTSLYTLFPTTPDILRRYGPTIARGKNGGTLPFGYNAGTDLYSTRLADLAPACRSPVEHAARG